MEVRFISDLHFGHKNIISYDGRPFSDVAEMDDAMTSLWNETVRDDDLTYVLGDISWAWPDKTERIYKRLNGRMILVRGNHDSDKLLKHVGHRFEKVVDYLEISDGADDIVLSHFPIPFFKNAHHGALHFYGHVHNSWEWEATEGMRMAIEDKWKIQWNMVNVGCMMPYVNYIPRTKEELLSGYSKFASAREKEI